MAGFEDDAEIEAPPPKRPGMDRAKINSLDSQQKKPADKPAEKPVEIEAENLVALVDESPLAVLQDVKKREKLYGEIRKLISQQKPDLTTQAGRDRVKSFTYKITRTRTAMDAAGKAFTEQAREVIKNVNDMRNAAEVALKNLEVEARLPLTNWEEEQAKHAQERAAILQQMTRAAATQHMSAPDLKDLQIDIEAIVLDPDLWGEDLQMVTDRQAEVVSMIDAKIIAEEARQRAATAEAENQALRDAAAAAAPATTADPNPPGADPVYEQRETPPLIGQPAPLAAGTTAKPLTPVQQARRLVLPPLAALGIEGEAAKALILAIEAGQLPGITATYLET